MKKYLLLFILLLNLIATPIWAVSTFVIKQIQVQGLQLISPETVYSYLPVKRGDTMTPNKTGTVIRALYQTGFFEHITLSRSGNTLIIRVVERAIIGQIKISGNSTIPTDKLTTVMKSLDIAEGRPYNRAVIEKIKLSLLNQYYQLGRYNARVDVSAIPQGRNRVLLNIDISEGLVAKIQRINIIGNSAFSEKELVKQLTISTPGLFTIVTQTDRYSQEKLDASLESLRNYYLDHGYIKFNVRSAQVAITPDRKSVYVTIVVSEGVPYTLKGYDFSGNLILPRSELVNLVKVKAGATFSRQAVIDSEKAISEALGSKGYAFATVTVDPQIDDRKKEVFLVFEVKPGKRAYVRHISFLDNTRTNDDTLRREMRQMEGSVVSTSKLDESKRSLGLLPYIKDVQMSIVPVQEADDQVDVNYKLTEDNAAQATFSLGYSQKDGPILGAGLNQKNFLGTGKTLGFNFSQSRFEQFYSINYTNPYYTPDGISRTISVSASRIDPAKAHLTNSYATNEYDASVLYSIPIGNEQKVTNRVQLGYGYQNTLIHVLSGASQQVTSFTNQHGRHYQQLQLMAGASRDSRDKVIFPTRGMFQSVGLDAFLPLDGLLRYYSASYNNRWYLPLSDSFIFTTRGVVAYGNAFDGVLNYPFFKNFYAGGIDSVHGYLGNSLGPKDSNQKPMGGNLLGTISAGLIFPNYISDSVRTMFFVDAGNVYNTYNNRQYNGSGSGPLRYSTGLQVDWLTPFGMIAVSLAKPINVYHNRTDSRYSDQTEPFQFSLGANFG